MAQDTICTGAKLAAIADAIRAKAGTVGAMTLDDMSAAVDGLATGGGGDLDGFVAAGPEGSFRTEAADVRHYAFFLCTSMTRAELPNVTTLGDGVFTGCTSLTEVSLPMLERFTGDPFKKLTYDYDGRTYLLAAQPPIAELDLPSLTTARYPLKMPPSIERLRLANMVEANSNYSNACFADFRTAGISSSSLALSMPRLRAILGGDVTSRSFLYAIPATVTGLRIHLPLLEEISGYAIYSCPAITSLYLPSLASVGSGAFYGCSGLETLVLPGQVVCSLACNPLLAFAGTPIASGSGYVYVPASLVAQYQAAANWSAYASQIRAIEDWPDEVAGARALYDAAAACWDG